MADLWMYGADLSNRSGGFWYVLMGDVLSNDVSNSTGMGAVLSASVNILKFMKVRLANF